MRGFLFRFLQRPLRERGRSGSADQKPHFCLRLDFKGPSRKTGPDPVIADLPRIRPRAFEFLGDFARGHPALMELSHRLDFMVRKLGHAVFFPEARSPVGEENLGHCLENPGVRPFRQLGHSGRPGVFRVTVRGLQAFLRQRPTGGRWWRLRRRWVLG